MRLSEIKDERALDVLAEIIDPVAEIATDEKIKKIYKSGKPRILIAKEILKNHKKAIIKIMAELDEVPVDKYTFTLTELPAKVLDIMNDPEIERLFQSQGQKEDAPNSGSVTENTEGGDQ